MRPKDGVVVVSDLGAVSVFPPGFEDDEETVSLRDYYVRTPGFSGPERWRCDLGDGRIWSNSDQYSFGKTMQYLLALIPSEQRWAFPLLDWPDGWAQGWTSLTNDDATGQPGRRPRRTKEITVLSQIVESCLSDDPVDR